MRPRARRQVPRMAKLMLNRLNLKMLFLLVAGTSGRGCSQVTPLVVGLKIAQRAQRCPLDPGLRTCKQSMASMSISQMK